jgi:High-temperature-induced dauer-formation protein
MKYNPAGWHLPYEHYVISDPKRLLVTYSLQTLLVLLTHDIQPENATPTEHPQKNMYRFYLGKLHRTDDFQFLVDGINRLLSLPIQSNASVLPGSQRSTKAHSEAMVLFWEVWKCNKVSFLHNNLIVAISFVYIGYRSFFGLLNRIALLSTRT